MNYLAHIYLSGGDKDLLLGNFIADAVKGKQFEDYPEGVKKGILLHRFIDDFTDSHPTVLETKVLFRPVYHKLAPILVDILYDHFLAKNWAKYNNQPLQEYVDEVYSYLNNRKPEMPERIQFMLPYMIRYDWLFNYQFQEGIERALLGMSKRVNNGSVLKYGWRDLEPVYIIVQEQFESFMAELIPACKEWLANYE